MKRILSIILLATIVVSINAQRITRSYTDEPLPKALMELNDMQNDYTISFIYDDLRDFTVTAKVENATVQEAIEQITRLYNIRTTVVGKTILVESGIKGNRLRGTVIDTKNRPVEYANVSLLSTKDSTFITGGVSNELGRFVIPCNEDEVIMRMTCIGMKTLYRKVKTGYIGTVRMQTGTYTLKEVEVKADPFIRKEDHLIIIPNKNDVKHAYTGYDLLYNMMIPGINVDRHSGSVEAMGGGATLYINGIQADGRDIKNLKPKDVIKIEYYEMPMGEYSGDHATINFIVKKYQYGGYVALDGKQNIGYLDGEYNLASKLSHNNTSYTLYAEHSMQEYNDNRSRVTEDFHFDDYSLTRESGNSKAHSEKNNQYAQLKISNQKDKRTLEAIFGLTRSASPDNNSQSFLTYSDLYDDNTSNSASNSRSISPIVELRGKFNPKKGHIFQVNFRGTYSNNHYNRTYSEGSYNSLSNVKEDIFSFQEQLKYTFPLKNKKSLSLSLWNHYQSSDADYKGTNESWQHLWSDETLFFVYYDWKISNKIYMSNRAGLSYEVYRHHGNDKVENFSPRYNTSISYNITKKQRLSFNGALGNSYPDISALNSAEQSVDVLYMKRGNPYLKNTILYDLGLGYSLMFGRFSLWSQIASSNQINTPWPVFSNEGNRVVESYSSDYDYHYYHFTNELTYRPTDALKLRFVGQYRMYRINGPQDLSLNSFVAVLYVNYYWKDFALNLYARSSSKKLGGDGIMTYTDPSYNASISWSHGNWYAEVGANNFFTNNHESRSEIISDVYNKRSFRFNRTDQRKAYIKLAYSFNFGKKVKQEQNDVDKSTNSAILKAE